MANVQGVISSSASTALWSHGLSERGQRQVMAGVDAFAQRVAFGVHEEAGPRRVAVIASDFRRTVETADIASSRLAATPGIEIIGGGDGVQLSAALRERDFGALDGCGVDRYEDVWRQDARSADHTRSDVESVQSVLQRAVALVGAVDAALARVLGAAPAHAPLVLLVAHGDVLQILQTAFAGVQPSEHRSLPHLDTAEIRELLPSRHGS